MVSATETLVGTDGRVLLVCASLLKGCHLDLGSFSTEHPVDGLERLTRFAEGRLQGVTDQVESVGRHYAGPQNGRYCFGKAFEAPFHSDEGIAEVETCALVYQPQWEFFSFDLRDSQSQGFVVSKVATDSDIQRIVECQPLFPNHQPHGVEVDDGVGGLQRAVLPEIDLVEGRVSNRWQEESVMGPAANKTLSG